MNSKQFQSKKLTTSHSVLNVKSTPFADFDFNFVGDLDFPKTLFSASTRQFSLIRLQSTESYNLKLEGLGTSVMLTFLKKGSLIWKSQNGDYFQLEANYANILLPPFFNGELLIKPHIGGIDLNLVMIEPIYFSSLLNLNCESHRSIYENMAQNSMKALKYNFSLNPDIDKLLIELCHIQDKNEAEHLRFNSLILQVIALSIESAKPTNCCISSNDCPISPMKPLLEAQRILKDNLVNPPSLGQLSKMIGINEFYLKKRFKENFGTTVFGYLAELRMEKASELLKEQGKSVAETSMMVGYKNPQHFSTAFKKKFGYKPSSVKPRP